MRNNTNFILESFRTSRIPVSFVIILVVLLLLIVIGFCIGELAYIWSWTRVLSILAGGLIIVIALLRVEFGIALLILVAMDMLGFMDSETFLRIPGLFKFQDLLFVILMVRMAADLLINRTTANRLRSPVTKPVLFLLACTALVIFLTAMFRDTSIVLSLRVGRTFLYYSIFFLVLYYVRNEKQLRLLLNACFVFSFVVAVLLIVQFAVGRNVSLVPYWKIGTQRVGSYVTFRVYPRGIPVLLMGFLCFVGALYHKLGNRSFQLAVITGILGLGVVLQLYRTIWAVAIIGVIFSWFIVQRKYKVHFFRRAVPLIGIILLLGMLIIPLYGTALKVSFVKVRFLSIFQDFFGVKGNYALNLAVAAERLQFIKSNPIWGMGFVHPSEPFSLQLIGQSVGNIDNAWITILSYMGALGALSILWLSIAFMKRSLFILRNIKDSFYKGVLVGFIGFYIACLISLLYISPFVYGEGIAIIALIIGLSEVILRVKVQ